MRAIGTSSPTYTGGTMPQGSAIAVCASIAVKTNVYPMPKQVERLIAFLLKLTGHGQWPLLRRTPAKRTDLL
jgi:hypothetical protein